MLESTAVVATEAPERYAKQLLAHLGRKNTVETVGGERQGGRLVSTAALPSGRRTTNWCSRLPPRTPTRWPTSKTCSPAT